MGNIKKEVPVRHSYSHLKKQLLSKPEYKVLTLFKLYTTAFKIFDTYHFLEN